MTETLRTYVILVAVSVVLGAVYLYHPLVPVPNTTACPADVKRCPDGTSVERTGPHCTFAPCPAPAAPDIQRLHTQLGTDGTVDGITLSPIAVLEDSRCPSDAVCVWEGRMRVQVRVTDGVAHTTREFALGTPVSFGAYTVTLESVYPAPSTKEPVAASAYRFVFTVEKR